MNQLKFFCIAFLKYQFLLIYFQIISFLCFLVSWFLLIKSFLIYLISSVISYAVKIISICLLNIFPWGNIRHRWLLGLYTDLNLMIWNMINIDCVSLTLILLLDFLWFLYIISRILLKIFIRAKVLFELSGKKAILDFWHFISLLLLNFLWNGTAFSPQKNNLRLLIPWQNTCLILCDLVGHLKSSYRKWRLWLSDWHIVAAGLGCCLTIQSCWCFFEWLLKRWWLLLCDIWIFV